MNFDKFPVEGDVSQYEKEEEDIAYYVMGKSFYFLYGRSLDEIKEVIKNPEKGKEFGLSDQESRDVSDWIEQVRREQQVKKEWLRDLKNRHPENSLMRQDIMAPENYASVYHFTGESSLEIIASQGLRAAAGAELNNVTESKTLDNRADIDAVFDQSAPRGFSRAGSVYAFTDYREGRGNGMIPQSGIALEARVDPQKAIVVDADIMTSAAGHFAEKVREKASSYWEGAMTLEDFLKLSPDERQEKFGSPEILIPGGVEPSHLRVHSVEFVT